MSENKDFALTIDNNVKQIKELVLSSANNVTDAEFMQFIYMAKKYELEPLLGEIYCIKFGTQKASIFAGRDGFLNIAHRSGQFDGIESGIKEINGEVYGWARVYRKDMSHPFYVECPISEYIDKRKPLWEKKPLTMIKKVAESQALRKAFSIHGLYDQSEEWSQPQNEIENITPQNNNPPATTTHLAPEPRNSPQQKPVKPVPKIEKADEERRKDGVKMNLDVISKNVITDIVVNATLIKEVGAVKKWNEMTLGELTAVYNKLKHIPKRIVATTKDIDGMPTDPKAERDIMDTDYTNDEIEQMTFKQLNDVLKKLFNKEGIGSLYHKAIDEMTVQSKKERAGVTELQALYLIVSSEGVMGIKELLNIKNEV